MTASPRTRRRAYLRKLTPKERAQLRRRAREATRKARERRWAGAVEAHVRAAKEAEAALGC